MTNLEEEKRKSNIVGASSLDSRLHTGIENIRGPSQTWQRPQTYRVQGHTPLNKTQKQRMSFRDIMAMPKGSRPKPTSECWNCQGSTNDPYHWRDECPFDRKQPYNKQAPRNPNYRPAQNVGQNRAPPAPRQQRERQKPHFGTGLRGPRPQQCNRRVAERPSSNNAIASATALLATMAVNDRRSFLVDQAKGLGL
jgi:hypothetical protein